MSDSVFMRWPYRMEGNKPVRNTCRCGCNGRDAMHAVKIRRVVRNVTTVAGNARVSGIFTPLPYDAEGQITHAGETVRVVRITKRWYATKD